MEEQQNHLVQLTEQRQKLVENLGTLEEQTTQTRELILKTQGAIEYLEAVGVQLPAPAEELKEEG